MFSRNLSIVLAVFLAVSAPVVCRALPQVENVLDLSGLIGFAGGVAYDSSTDHLFVTDIDTDMVFEVNRADGAFINSWALPAASVDATGITYNPGDDHLYYVSEINSSLYDVLKDGTFVDLTPFSIPPTSVSGCTINTSTGTLFVVDDQGGTMFESLLDGTVIAVRNILGLGIFDADGVAYNATDDHMFIGDDTSKLLFEVSTDATVLYNIYNLGPAGLNTGGVEGLAFDAAAERLFLVHGGTRKVFEISGVTSGGGVAVEPATWGGVKSLFR